MISRNLLAQGVIVERRDAVMGYLHHNAHWEPALNAFIRRAKANLPSQTELSVELYHDRESASDEIVLWARHSNYPDEFHELVKRVRRLVRRDIDLRPLVRKGGKITICTDFGRPHAT